jgi:hypothetical protein
MNGAAIEACHNNRMSCSMPDSQLLNVIHILKEIP